MGNSALALHPHRTWLADVSWQSEELLQAKNLLHRNALDM
jgi:hypothetical protein